MMMVFQSGYGISSWLSKMIRLLEQGKEYEATAVTVIMKKNDMNMETWRERLMKLRLKGGERKQESESEN